MRKAPPGGRGRGTFRGVNDAERERENRQIAKWGGIALGALLPLALLAGMYGIAPDPPRFDRPTNDVEAQLIHYVQQQDVHDRTVLRLMVLAGTLGLLGALSSIIGMIHRKALLFTAFGVSVSAMSALLVLGISIASMRF